MQLEKIVSEEQLQKAFKIREEVFVIEQGVPIHDEYDQYDSLEGDCVHILLYLTQQTVGTARVREVEGFGKLERICLLPQARNLGLGKEIVTYLEKIGIGMGLTRFKLHAQTQARGFYEKLGYNTASEVFIEDGIPHVLMTKTVETK